MHNQYTDRRLLWATLAVLIIMCLSCINQTPVFLVSLAVGAIIIGILGWFSSGDLPYPWLIRLGSTLLIGLGAAFLIWYISIGRTLLHPLIDMQNIFNSINGSLSTPAP